MRRWASRAAIGSEESFWRQMQMSSPFDLATFVKGRRQTREPFELKGGPRWDLQTTFEGEKKVSHWERISPRRNWAHMAQVAATRQQTSKGSEGDK